MDIRNATIARSYAATRPAISADPEGGASKAIAAGINDFAATLQRSETAALNAMTHGADPHALVTALAQTELAVQTAVTLRDKVVEAYQEILRMPV